MNHAATTLFAEQPVHEYDFPKTSEGVSVPDVVNSLVLTLSVIGNIWIPKTSLDVWVQTTIDGSTWFDIAQFTQVLGAAPSDLQYVLKIPAVDIADGTSEPAEFESSTALARPNSYRSIFGNQYRIRYTIVAKWAGYYTISVSALGM